MRVIDLNMLDYHAAWGKQEEVHAQVQDGADETVLLVEHPPTITLGRRAEASAAHLRATPAELRNLKVELVESDRGGDITYHGPGQLVAYPIIRLADHGLSVGAYMRVLQEIVVETVKAFGVEAHLDTAAPGVWAPDPGNGGAPAKLCAVGVRVRRGITMHGLALNVEPELSHFELIDPCGLGRPVTSLHKLLHHRAPSIEAVKAVLVRLMRDRFQAERPA